MTFGWWGPPATRINQKTAGVITPAVSRSFLHVSNDDGYLDGAVKGRLLDQDSNLEPTG
jgi:hypothetical protein